MCRFWAVFWSALVAIAVGGSAFAQDLSGLARLDTAKSVVRDVRGGARIELGLSQGVPWRIFTLDDPRRIVLDFREVDWGAADKTVLLNSDNVPDLRFGTYRPGWSRMVLDLDDPMKVDSAEMRVSDTDGTAALSIELRKTDAQTFAARAGAPRDPNWDLPEPAITAPEIPEAGTRPLVVVIDPGHGGIDPGAERSGTKEKHLMLRFAREIREVLRRTGGFDVILTRDDDVFVSLERRVAIAHQVGADVFISLHADVISFGRAQGATVYTLSKDATDAASQMLAERHDRLDILSGVDLSGQDDVVADVLLDLARMETEPRTERLARAMVLGLNKASGELNRQPYRQAAFSVLKAADIPSVLIEVGFMSSDQDLANLRNPEWRERIAGGIRDGLQAWAIADKALRDLVRQ